MGTSIDRAGWEAAAAALFAEIVTWRAAHPAATLDAIEDAVEERLAALRQRVVTETVQTSGAVDLGTGGARVPCPACGERLQAKGRARRTVQTGSGTRVTLDRDYGRCPRCGAGGFPP
jgi:hypothetical protein